MASFAIVQIGGKQYKVTEGSELLVDKLNATNGGVTLDKVLLFVDGGEVKIGTPTVSGAQVVAKVLGQEKGEKVTVLKFKAKLRYRRKSGFRAALTRIKIDAIKVTLTKKNPKKI